MSDEPLPATKYYSNQPTTRYQRIKTSMDQWNYIDMDKPNVLSEVSIPGPGQKMSQDDTHDNSLSQPLECLPDMAG